jgi:hypothetical protein
MEKYPDSDFADRLTQAIVDWRIKKSCEKYFEGAGGGELKKHYDKPELFHNAAEQARGGFQFHKVGLIIKKRKKVKVGFYRKQLKILNLCGIIMLITKGNVRKWEEYAYAAAEI